MDGSRYFNNYLKKDPLNNTGNSSLSEYDLSLRTFLYSISNGSDDQSSLNQMASDFDKLTLNNGLVNHQPSLVDNDYRSNGGLANNALDSSTNGFSDKWLGELSKLATPKSSSMLDFKDGQLQREDNVKLMSEREFKILLESIIVFCNQSDAMVKRNILNYIAGLLQLQMSAKQCQNLLNLVSAIYGSISENYYSDPLQAFYNQELLMLLLTKQQTWPSPSSNQRSMIGYPSLAQSDTRSTLIGQCGVEQSSATVTSVSDWLLGNTTGFNRGPHAVEPHTASGLGRGGSNAGTTLRDEIALLSMSYSSRLGVVESDIEKAAALYRTSATAMAQTKDPVHRWSGKLPAPTAGSGSGGGSNPCFSRKVFLGGVPWDSTEDDLRAAFLKFGPLAVMFPQKELNGVAKARVSVNSLKGYCYVIFDAEESVGRLLQSCSHHNPGSQDGDFFRIASAKFRSKEVQVIPWHLPDSQHYVCGPDSTGSAAYKPDSKRTVFIGALHGMITACGLARIIHELFDNVVFAALDTDKYKYPIGSGRVTFSSQRSYMRAVTANFVHIRTDKFTKTIQIDPYLEDSMCNNCFQSPGIYFCRSFECFRYFCSSCWQVWHSRCEALFSHKPLRRTFKPLFDYGTNGGGTCNEGGLMMSEARF